MDKIENMLIGLEIRKNYALDSLRNKMASRSKQNGATTIEYVVIAAIIVSVAVLVMKQFGTAIKDRANDIVNSINSANKVDY